MKVCIITSQLIGKHKIGGFGSMAKHLALELAENGIEVAILTLSSKTHTDTSNQFAHKKIELIYLKKSQIFNLNIYRKINADIYHSQNQHILSSLVRIAEPLKKHVVTCRDPRNLKNWKNEFVNATFRRKIKIPLNYLLEESKLAYWYVQKADTVGVPAMYLKEKVLKMYKLTESPIFLPNLEDVPNQIPKKTNKPSVIWVGRFAKRKFPETYIDLALEFAHVNFVMIGKAEEKGRQNKLDQHAKNIPNLKLLGFKDKFEDTDFYDYYNRSWIIINTSSREGLPLTFVEAAGRGCAILSALDPEGFASNFGYFAKNRDFARGLKYLLSENKWKELGKKGHAYVKSRNHSNSAIHKYIELYKALLKTNGI